MLQVLTLFPTEDVGNRDHEINQHKWNKQTIDFIKVSRSEKLL